MNMSKRYPAKAIFCLTCLIVGLTACSGRHGAGGAGSEAQNEADLTSKFRIGKPYQATYDMPGGKEVFYWDGAGHIRMDMIAQGGISPTMVTVLDQKKNETIAWGDGAGVPKYYSRGPARRTDPLMILVYPTVKPTAADGLGAKTINGHNCHGWKGGLDPNSEIWLDDDCGCIVELKTTAGSLKLNSLSTEAPGPSVFEPPPDFKARGSQ